MNWLIEKCEAVRRSTIRRGAVETVTGYAPLALPGNTGERLKTITVYGKSVQNGTPTPDVQVPVISVGGKTRSRGKNLFDPIMWSTPETAHGLTIQYINSEDCFVLNGTTTATSAFVVKNINSSAIYGQYYFVAARYVGGSITRPNNETAVAYFGAANAINTANNWCNVRLDQYDNSKSVLLNYNYITRFWFYITAGVSFDNYKVKIQLEQSSTATPYAPFASPSIITLPTLHGIPLASSATDYTYIDSNGVKYAADEWTWREEGIWEHVQRVGVRVFDGTEKYIFIAGDNTFTAVEVNINSDPVYRTYALCSHFKNEITYTANAFWIESSGKNVRFTHMGCATIAEFTSFLASNNVTVYYKLATPIITQYPHIPWMHTIDASHAGNTLDVAYLDNIDGTTTMPWVTASYYKEVVA